MSPSVVAAWAVVPTRAQRGLGTSRSIELLWKFVLLFDDVFHLKARCKFLTYFFILFYPGFEPISSDTEAAC